MQNPVLKLAAIAAALLPLSAYASCGAAFCTVNTNWTTQSAQIEAGTSYDLRYESMQQDQVYNGSDRIAVGGIHHHHDEVSTDNRNLVATLSHNFANGWGVSLTMPLVDKDHLHIHNHHGGQIDERWNFRKVGDVRVQGRYQFLAPSDPLAPSSAGLSFGLKLPTGKQDVANGDGDVAERSLQSGSGTTDLLLGAYYHRTLTAEDASWFVQGQYQHALNEHHGYKPGAQIGMDMGVRKGMGDKLGALLQLNLLHKSRDSGSEAEPADSGGRYIFLSPGLSYALTGQTQLYGFYQHALYRKVNGVQLTAPHAFVFGIAGRL